MPYYKRISDNDMNSEFVDGSLLLHTDMNEIETLTKAGINANYEDIQKLQDGTLTVQNAVNATNALNANNATALSGATLSKSSDETLQNSDSKVPTSKQVKNYVDNETVKDYDDLLNRPSINGVVLTGNKTSADLGLDIPFYYWDGTNTPANVAMFNEICQRYTNGYPFIFMGRVEVQNGYYDENGEFVDRTIPVVTEISVKNMEPYESPSMTSTFLSFMTQPIKTTAGYAIGSINLVGTTWGEYTEIQPMSWSYTECPIIQRDAVNTSSVMPEADFNHEDMLHRYVGDEYNLNGFVKNSLYRCVNKGNSQTPRYEWVNVSKDNYLGENFMSDYTSINNNPISDFGLWETINVTNLQPGTYLLGLTSRDINLSSSYFTTIEWVPTGGTYPISESMQLWSNSWFEDEDTNLRLMSDFAEIKVFYSPNKATELPDDTVLIEIKTLIISDAHIFVNVSQLKVRQANSDHVISLYDCYSYSMAGITDYRELNFKPSINGITLSGNKTSSQLGLQDVIQYSTMPTASSTTLDKIVQYIGTTDSSYTHGYYYQVVSDGASTPTYSWERIDVQPSGGSGDADRTYLGNASDYLSENNALDITDLPLGVYFLNNTVSGNYKKLYLKFKIDNVYQTAYASLYTSEQDIIKLDLFNKDIGEGTSGYATLGRIYQGSNFSNYAHISYKKATIRVKRSNRTFNIDDSDNSFEIMMPNVTTTVSVKHTYTTLPESSVVPTTDNQLVNKKYVDDVAGGGGNTKSYYLGKLSDFDTEIKALDITNLDVGQYSIGCINENTNFIYIKATYKGTELVGGVSVYPSLSVKDDITLSIETKISDDLSTTTLLGRILYYEREITNRINASSKYIRLNLSNPSSPYLQTNQGSDTKTEPQILQLSYLPLSDSNYINMIVQYTGTTDSNYTNGYFYKYLAQGTTPETYAWERVDIQPNSGSGSTEPYYLGNMMDFDTSSEALDLTNLDVGEYAIGIHTNETSELYLKATYNGETLTAYGSIGADSNAQDTVILQISTKISDNLSGRVDIGKFVYRNTDFAGRTEYYENTITLLAYSGSTPELVLNSSTRTGISNTYIEQLDTLYADPNYINRIVQYIGDTDSNYTNGHFYKYVLQTGTQDTYIWEEVEVQTSSGGGSSLQNIVDESGTGSVRTTGARTSTYNYSFAEGYQTIASSNYSHAEGKSTTSSGGASHAEGEGSRASGYGAHAEGYQTLASGANAHAEGQGNFNVQAGAIGTNSHAEGYSTYANGNAAHAEGYSTKVRADYSHAEGFNTDCATSHSHVEGYYTQSTKSGNYGAHVQGRYNAEDNTDYAHIVGNGTYSQRSNCHTLDWDGNAWFAGSIKVGGTSASDTNAKTLIMSNANIVFQVLTATVTPEPKGDTTTAHFSLPTGTTYDQISYVGSSITDTYSGLGMSWFTNELGGVQTLGASIDTNGIDFSFNYLMDTVHDVTVKLIVAII